MKISELIKYLNEAIERDGDNEVSIEAELDGRRTEQRLFDVYGGSKTLLLVSKEAVEADPINALPAVELEIN